MTNPRCEWNAFKGTAYEREYQCAIHTITYDKDGNAQGPYNLSDGKTVCGYHYREWRGK